MTNNDILRRIRYLFNFNDEQLIALFKLAGLDVTAAQLEEWLRKEDDPTIVDLSDKDLATFLNGLVIEKRGKREGPLPIPEDPLSNNMVLRKIKIALELRSEDMIAIYALADIKISKGELGNFFRKESHESFRPVMNQYLRGFLNGLQIKYKNARKAEAKENPPK